MYNQVIIVEGIHDEERLKKIFPGIDTISVNGSEISDEVKKMIRRVSETRSIVLFFDPDYPGKRIRSIINEIVPNASHAFINKEDGISKNHKKVGVEHASAEKIKEALEHMLTPTEKKGTLTSNDLFTLGLKGKPDSSQKRKILCEIYHLDNPNGKTLLNRLNMLGLTIEDLKEVLL